MFSGFPMLSRISARGVRWSGSRILDLVYPRSCIGCQEPVDPESPFRFICLPCSRLVTIVRPPACGTCGYPFFGMVEADRVCAHCEEFVPLFGEARTATLMKGPVRELVHGLKYNGQFHLIEDIGRIFRKCEELLRFCEGAFLIPVPLHPRKRRERGFNQSHLIAAELGRLSGAAGVSELLVRVKDTVSQTAFDRSERVRNLKNAFALRGKTRLNPRLRYILVDDVFTTGSTCNACVAALRRAGIDRTDVITFGHG